MIMIVRQLLVILVATALIAGAIAQKSAFAQTTQSAQQIFVSIAPATVPADGDSYKIVYVALMDSNKNPIISNSRIDVSLSSSTPSIGTVDHLVTILPGSYYGVASFTSTTAAGTTTVYATAQGYPSAQAVVTTTLSADISPAALRVAAVPPLVPGAGFEGMVVVSLLNGAALPVVAKEDTVVTLTSSNRLLATVDRSVTIPAGQSFALAKYVTKSQSGVTTITGSSTGLSSDNTYVKTPSSALTVRAYPVTPTMATSSEGTQVVIQLENSKGVPVPAPSDLQVRLISTNADIFRPIPSTITIPKGESSFVAKAIGGGSSGSAMLNPVASGYIAKGASIQAQSSPTSGKPQLMIYTSPPNPSASTTSKLLVAAQLVVGNSPYPAQTPTEVVFSTTNSTIGRFDSPLVISPYSTVAFGTFNLSGVQGQTTITGTAEGYDERQTQVVVTTPSSTKLELFPIMTNVPAVRTSYPAFAVMLTTDGVPIVAKQDINVSLSGNPPNIADFAKSATIKRGTYYSIIEITPSGTAGSLQMFATADALGAGKATGTMSLMQFVPSSFQITTPFPNLVQTDEHGQGLVIVQLTDSKKQPDKNNVANTEIQLTMSPSTAGLIDEKVVIPRGENFAAAKLKIISTTGATVTGTAEGYQIVNANIKVAAPSLQVILTPGSDKPVPGETNILTARVVANGAAVPNASVTWSYDRNLGTLVSLSDVTDSMGTVSAYYNPNSTEAQTISVSASKSGFVVANSKVTLGASTDIGKNVGSLIPIFSPNLVMYVIIAAIAIEGFVIFRFYQQKRPLF